MNQCQIPDFKVALCTCLLAVTQISTAGADWTTKPSATGYCSDTGSYQTPPPGGWDSILEREIQQEKERRSMESQPADSSSQAEAVSSPASADTCDDTQAQQQMVYSANKKTVPGFRRQAYGGRRGRDASRSRQRDHDRGFGMPWGGDRGGSGFGMPWGGDSDGLGFMPWDDNRRGDRGFGDPWGGNGFGFSGPWEGDNRGSRRGWRAPW